MGRTTGRQILENTSSDKSKRLFWGGVTKHLERMNGKDLEGERRVNRGNKKRGKHKRGA